MKQLTLINPPWYYHTPSLEGIPHGPSQNLAIGYLAAYIEEKSNHKVQCIDALGEGFESVEKVDVKGKKVFRRGLPYDKTVNLIDPDTNLIGITVPFTTNARIVKELVPVIKTSFPKIPIVLGGVYPSTLPEKCLRNTGCNYVVVGEGEQALLDLLNDTDISKIGGLAYIDKNNHFVFSGKAPLIEDIDKIPFPARYLLPMDKYIKYSSRGKRNKRTASILTSRGCPYNCKFCSIHAMYGRKWRARSPENVIKEIKLLIDNYNINHIEFEDDNLNLKSDRLEEICNLIISLPTKITWDTPNGIRADLLTEGLVKKMKKSGCIRISIPVESGDPEIIKLMGKKSNLAKYLDVVRWCSKYDMRSFGFFIIGYPGETKESFVKSLNFALEMKNLGCMEFGATTIKAYPQTQLAQLCKEKGYLVDTDIDEKLILGEYVSITTPGMNEAEVLWRLDHFNRMTNPQLYAEKWVQKYPFLSSLNNLINRFVPLCIKSPLKNFVKKIVTKR